MKLERIAAAAAAGAFSLVAAATLSSAMPLAQTPPSAAGQAGFAVERVHGCHPSVLQDSRGWHFHDRACGRRNTAPPGLYDGPDYRRVYRGPVCSYRCQFVGPVKTCSQVCR